MSVLGQIAHFRGRRDEVPNVELAVKLAGERDRAGIRELATHLQDPDPRVAADCLKVLCELAEREPLLAAPYAQDFLALLASRNNRMVWGAMTALSTIARVRPGELYSQRARILAAMEHGSVITMDRGIRTLARLAEADPRYRRTLLPVLFRHLQACRPKDVPQHAESIAPAVGPTGRNRFVAILERRANGMPEARQRRILKVIRGVGG